MTLSANITGMSPTFEEEKGGLDQKHQALRDKIMAQKQAELDRLRAEGREPFPLPHLDERKTILNQTPRSQPVQPPSQLQTIKQKEQ